MRPSECRSRAAASSARYSGFSYRMSMTPVPTSMFFVRAAMADSSGMGDAAWRAKWWTRKYAPLTPISSAATDSSTACLSMSEAVWPEPGPP